ncbi:PEP-CTERM-box response regulator transcription factor [Oleidesulfovibrio sp.]|uniref:PEP-CTERM-box response regulator transcription factor n=1 Tax=Oleidesulfovibrio sp. TaxID=2909707 RepID=UPI003A8759C6
MGKLLIVDDNEDVRRQLRWGLSREPYELLLAADGEEALKIFREQKPGVVTLDLGLPPDPEGTDEGFRCLEAMVQQNRSAQVVVVTGHHDKENALRAIRGGAFDFCRKPVDLAELKVIINRAFYLSDLKSADQQDEPPAGYTSPQVPHFNGLVGDCPAMRSVYATIEKVAGSDAPVLITGESGTGKELVARALHSLSSRRKASMIAVNCGAIPENLIESELFGHEKGAFTGATNRVQGKVEYADGGTLFLDEIGELPAPMQVKFLRFLQEMVIQRVGGRKDIPVNCRIIAATNIDIEEAMRQGTFREDLYFRIGVVTIKLPPLRDRGSDVMLLAEHFLQTISAQQDTKVQGFSSAAEKAMLHYTWPGNVRELENKVRRAIILASGQRIGPEDLGIETDGCESTAESCAGGIGGSNRKTLKEARNAVEREMVENALRVFSGNIVQAAKSIGVSRPTFYDLLKKHGLDG